MRALVLLTTFLASLAITLGAHGCNEDTRDCRQLCVAAQADDCTSITGDCGDFCASLTNVQGPAGCEDERDAYESCLNDDGVCNNSCNSSESALSACVGLYCATRTGEADCMTLIDSF